MYIFILMILQTRYCTVQTTLHMYIHVYTYTISIIIGNHTFAAIAGTDDYSLLLSSCWEKSTSS